MKRWIAAVCFCLVNPALANESGESFETIPNLDGEETVDACVLAQMKSSLRAKSYEQWVEHCENLAQAEQESLIEEQDQTEPQQGQELQWEVVSIDPVAEENMGIISKRMLQEAEASTDPFTMLTHRRNYILPVYTTNAINRSAYSQFPGVSDNLDKVEAKFQLSFKIPLNGGDMFVEYDRLYFGFTLEAWWQVYAEEISRPFRETNYRPEIYYFMPTNWHPFGGNFGMTFGLEHQSNGQFTEVSRSWNRLYTGLVYENGSFAAALQPWYRLPEDEPVDDSDPSDDDNPDIEDYMGHFELRMGYSFKNSELTFLGRQNFETGYGAAELGYSFPLWGQVRGYTTAFHGYGDSLIDYNFKQTRFGLGLAFNRLF